ncbi:uncharacterized protein RSE6_04961 [Rhynchosporium secalis]|uniref:DNA replication complex GINS protein PSF2 n=1 Tax=Rhynchosporium secalis TaxID=38038 RepID=A0A1E1M7V1_RHYSE|nr:uncharacterized protein RSE6_04961 [Rhynchosporium secalis]
MALPLQAGLTPMEVAFLCEMEMITVVPRQRLESLNLLAPTFPSGSPSLLKRQRRANILPPPWLLPSSLDRILTYETDISPLIFSPPPPYPYTISSRPSPTDHISPPFLASSTAESPPDYLPYHWLELGEILLEACPDDIPDPGRVRSLLRDLREVRIAKMRSSVKMLEGGGPGSWKSGSSNTALVLYYRDLEVLAAISSRVDSYWGLDFNPTAATFFPSRFLLGATVMMYIRSGAQTYYFGVSSVVRKFHLELEPRQYAVRRLVLKGAPKHFHDSASLSAFIDKPLYLKPIAVLSIWPVGELVQLADRRYRQHRLASLPSGKELNEKRRPDGATCKTFNRQVPSLSTPYSDASAAIKIHADSLSSSSSISTSRRPYHHSNASDRNCEYAPSRF